MATHHFIMAQVWALRDIAAFIRKELGLSRMVHLYLEGHTV